MESETLLEPNRDSVPQGIYRHFEGNIYHVFGVSEHAKTNELTVVCIPQYGPHADELVNWPLAMFLEEVDCPELGHKVPRFALRQEHRFT